MFVSTYESAIDAKGRVSIPAPFRAALGGGSRVFLWPALDGSGCLEGGGEALMAMYRATLTRLPPQSMTRKALVNGIFAKAADLKMDETGRVKLTESLREMAALKGRVTFAGNIDSFQIWSPDRHAAYDAKMESQASSPEALAALGEAYNDVLQAAGGADLSSMRLVSGDD
ncbi:MAG: division/cell wall cluster transcriptional repressor MraZ [Hyphomonas sp.]